MWLNLRGFGDVLDPITRDRMFVGAALVTAAAVIFLGLGARASRPPRRAHQRRDPVDYDGVLGGGADRGPRPGTAAAVAGAADDARGREPKRPPRTRTIRHADVRRRVARRDLRRRWRPAACRTSRRIFDQGAVLHLATLRPTQAEPVWSAIATGRYPMSNGVRSAVVYRALGGTPIQLLPDYCFTQALVTFGFLSEQPQTATDLLARPIWNILSDRGAERRRDRLAADATRAGRERLCRQRRVSSAAGSRAEPGSHAGAVAAAISLADALAALQMPADPDPVSLVTRDGRAAAGQRLRRAQRPGADRRRSRAPAVAECARNAGAAIPGGRVFPASMPSGHRFLRYADPSAFGDVSEAERAEVRRRAESVLRLHRHAGRPRDRAAGPERFAAGRVGVRHGAAVARQARARNHCRQSADQRHARARARRFRARLWSRRWRRAVRHARRSSTWRRRFCIFSGCRSAATWTALRASTCSSRRSPAINR